MNYIEQIKAFWTLDKEHSFSGNESRLYFYLLELSNSLYWKNPIANTDRCTASMVGIEIKTLKTCRNRLQQAGLIRFKSGAKGAKSKSFYEIVKSAELINKVSGSSHLLPDNIHAKILSSETPADKKEGKIPTFSSGSLPVSFPLFDPNTATINKQKLNNTPYRVPL